MGFSVGSMVNSTANIASRKSDGGKASESSLYEFLTAISGAGLQIKANYEVEFMELAGFQFFCQSVSLPGLRSENGQLYYKGRTVQVPILCEQQHEFAWTVLNDGSGTVYTTLRDMMLRDYDINQRMLDNGYKVRVKARGDGQYSAGTNIVMSGVRITEVSGLDFAHTDANVSTFTVNGYVNFTDFEVGQINRKEGLLGKVDKISGKMSAVLGK